MKRIDLYADPTPATLQRAVAERLYPRTNVIDLLHDLLSRAQGMAGLLSDAAGAEALRSSGAFSPAGVEAVALSIRDELGMALALLTTPPAEPPGGDA